MKRVKQICESHSDCFFAICLFISLFTAANQARAEEPVRFEFPRQPLETALVAFGSLTGYSVLVASNLAVGREASAVYGNFEPREALERLLQGTGLSAQYSGAKAVTLTPVSSLPSSSDGAALWPGDRHGESAKTGYATVLQTSITRILCRAQPADFGRYRVALQLWISKEGAVSNVLLLESSGSIERDTVIDQSLRTAVMDKPPPSTMAQPITILLVPRANPEADCRNYATAKEG